MMASTPSWLSFDRTSGIAIPFTIDCLPLTEQTWRASKVKTARVKNLVKWDAEPHVDLALFKSFSDIYTSGKSSHNLTTYKANKETVISKNTLHASLVKEWLNYEQENTYPSIIRSFSKAFPIMFELNNLSGAALATSLAFPTYWNVKNVLILNHTT
jgi:transposase-like protein